MGLVILGLLALYVMISILVVIGVIKHAKKNGKSALRWGGAAALVLYLMPFWDWLPTVAMHRYYCATEAGFWVYKTIDQWKIENPGVMERLVVQRSIQPTSYGDLQTLNERFAIETHRRKPVSFLPTSIAERLLVDRKSGEVLAKGIDVGSGVGYMATGGGFKFWLNQTPCITEGMGKLTTEIQVVRGSK